MPLLIASQLFILGQNGFLEPDLTMTLHHTPLAQWVLNHYPQLYNPTPEIFIDRTNHQDISGPTTAIYRDPSGVCRKAYVLTTDVDTVTKECGPFPPGQTPENSLLRVASYPRSVVTTEATFWPHPQACNQTFDNIYACPVNLEDALKQFQIVDQSRLVKIPEYDYPGVWKLLPGAITRINVPAGYIIHHQSFAGQYVNY